MRTVVGVFPSRMEAEHVARDLNSVGIPTDEVTIANSAGADHREWSWRNIAAASGASYGWFLAGLIPIVAEQSRAAATGFGASVGGAAGAIAGLAALAIRGGVVAGSSIATVFTAVAIGAIAGGLIARVYSMGVSHEEVPLCEEAVREHGVVVAAHVDEPREPEALRVMTEHGARNMRADADAWLASGSTGAHVDEKLYPSDSSIRLHQPG